MLTIRDLSGAVISQVSGADLCGADLCGADLCGADLHGADLCGADLCEADLRGADLCEADLRGANLHGANLHGANLHGANLHGANLREAEGAVCLGYDRRGYRFIGIVYGGGWRILAGCRWFTVPEAVEHWSAKDNKDALARVAILQAHA